MKKRLLILCLMVGSICAACGTTKAPDESVIRVEEDSEGLTEEAEQEETEKTEEIENSGEAEKSEEIENFEEAEKSEEIENSGETEKIEDVNLFTEVKDREFYFSSGAGAWRTVLYINEDGSFSGEFSDSDMGDVGDGYPNGICYYCSFKGSFTKPVKVNDYTYSVGIAGIECDYEPGTEEIIDGILYRYSEPYGIDGTNSLLLYRPGALLEELPAEYLDWVRMGIADESSDELPFYGVYNEKEQTGFSSYEISDPMDELMASTEEWSNTLKGSLENDSLSQTEMNMKSYELYETWDTALNTLWAELKEILSEEKFQSLLNEQRAWIAKKEKAVDEAGADVAGGSMEPLVRNMTAADMTEKRVYELYHLLK